MTFEQIVKANEIIKTMPIKGKEYAQVNERIKAFRMLCPDGEIETEVVSIADGICIMRAYVRDEKGKLLGTGTAYEKEESSYINKTSYIENCETSAVGRALGMLALGTDTSVASYEEVANAVTNQPLTPKEIDRIKARLKELGKTEKEFCKWLGVSRIEKMTASQYVKACETLFKEEVKHE